MSWFNTDRVAVLLSAVALIGSGVGWWLNRRAAARAEVDAADARHIAERAVAAAERSASATERSTNSHDSMAQSLRALATRTDRVEAQLDEFLPKRSPLWAITPSTGRLFHVQNIGNATAYEVTLSSANATRFDGPELVPEWPVGTAQEIFVLGSWGSGTPIVRIEWRSTPVATETEQREMQVPPNG